jgi:hypothetical protein
MRFRWLVVGLCLLSFAACGGDPYAVPAGTQSAGNVGGGSGAVTGLLLNVQRPPDQVPFKGTLDEWKVVDPLGNPIFSRADTPPVGSVVGVTWEWKREEALNWSNKKAKLGDNFYEIRMVRDEYGPEPIKTGAWYVSDATAAELRNMPNLKELLKRAKLIILVGKQGQ